MKHTIACWEVQLNTDCPHCKEYVDLMDYPDFWDQHRSLDIAEHDTDRTKGVEVVCPKCGEEFTVDLTY